MKQQNNNATNSAGACKETCVDMIEDICAAKNVSFHPAHVARDIMSKDVKMVTLDHTVKDCIDFMKLHKVRHAPVVDGPNEKGGKPYFVGVISERDLLRQIWPHAGQFHGENADHKSCEQRMVHIVIRKPKCVSPETPIPNVILTMINNKIDMVPVLSDTNIVGIITTMDIIKCLFEIHDEIRRLCPEIREGRKPVDPDSTSLLQYPFLHKWFSLKVQEIMTKQVVRLGLHQTLAKAIEVLRKKHFRHLPIADKQGVLKGIISDRDVLRNLPPSNKHSSTKTRPFDSDIFDVDPRIMILDLPLARIMTWDITTISPGCDVYDAAETLYKMRISCLPAVDEGKKLCGIVTVTDLMHALLLLYRAPPESSCLMKKDEHKTQNIYNI